MLVGVVCVIVVTAITVVVLSGRERSRIAENRAMRDYVRRIWPDRDEDKLS
jgi:hypothetical protein